MFSRRLLAAHPELRYPEGKRRLEDQLFMVKAYYAARSTAIVGDYACYFYWRREDGANAGSTRIVPKEYYGNLREVLDIVEGNASSEAERLAVYERFFRVELLGRLSGGPFQRYHKAYRDDLVGTIRKLLADAFPADVDTLLPPGLRGRAALARRGDVDGLLAHADVSDSLKLRNRLEEARWDGDTLLVVRATTRLLLGDVPLEVDVVRDDAGAPSSVTLAPPFFDAVPEIGGLDVLPSLANPRMDVVVKMRDTAVEFFVPTESTVEFVPVAGHPTRHTVRYALIARLDPTHFNTAGRLPEGIWDLYVRAGALGLTRTSRLAPERAASVSDPGVRFGGTGVPTTVGFLTQGKEELSVAVDTRNGTVTNLLRAATRVLTRKGRGTELAVTVPLNAAVTPRTGEVRFRLVHQQTEKKMFVDAVPDATGPRTVWRARVSADQHAAARVREGVYALFVEVGEPGHRVSVPIDLVLDSNGRGVRGVRVRSSADPVSLPDRARHAFRRARKSVGRRLPGLRRRVRALAANRSSPR